jgi:hypothetical protein
MNRCLHFGSLFHPALQPAGWHSVSGEAHRLQPEFHGSVENAELKMQKFR